MTTASDLHNSHTCSLNAGGPCDLCSAANEYEQRRRVQLSEAEFVALATPVLERARADLNDGEKLTELRKVEPKHLHRILHALDNDRRFASLTTIRAALFDVIDDDDGTCWRFYPAMFANDNLALDEANERRCAFVDAVTAHIAELQRAPHNFDSQYSDYRTGYADGWVDAHTETLKLQNEDLAEMLRVGRERITR